MGGNFTCKPGDLAQGSDAILRNAGHIGSMSNYGAGLKPGDGTFSPIASNFESAYIRTVETQIAVLGQLRDKLTSVSRAISACKDGYVAADQASADAIEAIVADLNRVKADVWEV